MTKTKETLDICSCGHDFKHNQVEKLGIYSWWQWSFLIFGISVKAKNYRYSCVICSEDLIISNGFS